MNTSAPSNPYTHHRFPAEIISHGVWLYFRFCLSYRDVEELLFARGVLVTYESIRNPARLWTHRFLTVELKTDLLRPARDGLPLVVDVNSSRCNLSYRVLLFPRERFWPSPGLSGDGGRPLEAQG